MQRDYVRKVKPVAAAKPIQRWPWWLFGFLLGFILAEGIEHASFFLQRTKKVSSTLSSAPAVTQPTTASATTAPPTPTKVATTAPRFDFYTVLPSEGETAAGAMARSRSPETLIYFLEIARFSNYMEADQINTEIRLLGFDSKINTTKNGEKLSYDIRLGPFLSEKSAEKMRQKLAESNIKARVMPQQTTTVD